MLKGLIVKLQGGLYKVKTEDGQFINCKGRGKLRYQNESPIVGDYVMISINEKEPDKGSIEEVLERRNILERPRVSNVDSALIITSVREPNLNDFLLDKLLMVIGSYSIEPILIFTKMDLASESDLNHLDGVFKEYRRAGYKVIAVNNTTKEGIDEVAKVIADKGLKVITGQTGVGKSTILNNVNSSLNLETSHISKALGRGRHTTRHVELIEVLKDSFVIDTPGFSSFDVNDIDKSTLSNSLKDFEAYINKCKFNNCIHQNEPGCTVKKAVEEGKISQKRYNNYLKIIGDVF